MDASKNSGTPKSSILIGFSIINHPFWGIPIFGNTHIRYRPPGFFGPVFFGGEVCPFYNMDEFLCNHNDMFMMVVYGNEKSQTPLGPENLVFFETPGFFTNGKRSWPMTWSAGSWTLLKTLCWVGGWASTHLKNIRQIGSWISRDPGWK